MVKRPKPPPFAGSSPSARRRVWTPAIAVLLATIVTVSACGGDDNGDDNALAKSTGGPGGGAGTEAQEQAILDFYQCLRDRGLDVEDPDTSGGRARIRIGPDSGIDPENPEHKAALDECSEETGMGMGQPGEGNVADPEKLMDFVECMRENGIEDMPDPSAEGGLELPDGLDLESEEFQKASEICREELGGGGVMFTK